MSPVFTDIHRHGGFDEASASTRRKILIVEDEILIAMDLQGRLEGSGYEVPARADSATLALNLASSCSPDLILMDIRLRGEPDGIVAASEVRKTLNIPVIFLTSHADEDTLARARESEPYGYIVKPFGTMNFRGMIEMAIAKHEAECARRANLHWYKDREKSRLLWRLQNNAGKQRADSAESKAESPARRKV